MKEKLKELYKDELRVITYNIQLNPGKPKHQVSFETGVPIDIIIELIEAGILMEENAELKIATKLNCRNQERRKFVQSLRDYESNNDTNTVNKDDDNPEGGSKLLQDLKNLKERRIQNLKQGLRQGLNKTIDEK